MNADSSNACQHAQTANDKTKRLLDRIRTMDTHTCLLEHLQTLSQICTMLQLRISAASTVALTSLARLAKEEYFPVGLDLAATGQNPCSPNAMKLHLVALRMEILMKLGVFIQTKPSRT